MNDTISNNINNILKNNDMKSSYTANGDLEQQELLNKALISAGLPQNKLNDLIEQARDKLSCDADCQMKRKGLAYKQKWELAKKQYKEAPEEIKQAEKNYYIYDKGYGAYKDMLYDRYSKTAAEFKSTSNKKYSDLYEMLKLLVKGYNEGTTYLKRMNELLQLKLVEKEKLEHDIDAYISFTETSGRKVIYEDRERDSLTTYRTFTIYIFYAIIILYIVFGNFIPNKVYNKWQVWLIFFLFIIFPYYLVDKIVKYIFSLYSYSTSWRLKKNVYKNL